MKKVLAKKRENKEMHLNEDDACQKKNKEVHLNVDDQIHLQTRVLSPGQHLEPPAKKLNQQKL